MLALDSDVTGLISECAARRRLRRRNLHDGRPVPPTRAASGAPAHGYAGVERWDAIIGRKGYIAAGTNRLEWVVMAGGHGYLHRLLDRMRAIGAVVAQWGDTEAGGHAPLSSLGRLVPLIRPFRRRPGRPDWRVELAARNNAKPPGWPEGTPKPKSASISLPCRDE